MKEVNIISKVVGRSGAEASPSSAIIPNMSGYATKSELNTLRNEFKDFLEGADADVVINKWQDLVSFLEGISEDFDLLSMLGLKADKSELSNYVTIATEQTISAHKNFLNGLSIGGLPITKSQDDVIYLDANLVVRGGITMYATDAIDVPSIIDALPIASASAKGIAAFNPNDFSVVDGYVSFIGKGGVDESVLADYAKKADLSDYLPLSGGQMTGSIGYTLEPDSYEVGLPAAGRIYFTDFLKMLSTHKSFLASGYNIGDGNWYNIISLRHRNGADDGVSYGMYLYSSMTNYSDGNLYWGRQINGSWHNRVILDSVNWSQYVTSADGGSYLPLSGGEINSTNGSYALTIKANHHQVMLLQSNQSEASINYANNVGDVWVLGANAGGTPSSFGLWYDPITKLKFCVQKNGCTHIYYTATSIAGNNGSYTEGIRLYGATKDNSWSEINFGCDPNMTYDSHPNQWTIGRNGDPIYMNELTIRTYGSDKFVFFRTGDFLVSGGITMYSDIRKKTKLQDVELTLQQIADAPLIEHYYNSDSNKTTHVGSIAQYWASMNDWFCKLDNEGFYTMEIQNAALASAISIARELVKYESKTDRKIRLLKQRVKELEEKIEKLENN